jgi:hypothetical protein
MSEAPVLQEDDRIADRRVIAVSIAAVIVTALGLVVAYWLMPAPLRHRHLAAAQIPEAAPEIGMIEQRLFEGPPRGPDLAREQRAQLGRYGWVDKKAGIARIPIDQAKNLMLEQAAR